MAGNPNILSIGQETRITPANSRMLAQKSAEVRRRKAMLAAQSRTVARLAASDPTIQTHYDAWGELVADQAEALRQRASEGKPAGDDLHRVGQALGVLPLAIDAKASGQAGEGMTLHIDSSTARDMVAQLLEHRRAVASGEAEATKGEK